MDKEYTYFIVDLSPPMGEKNGGRTVTDLELGLEYVNGVIAQKIVRGKKTDQVAIIAAHHRDTENQLQDGGNANNINVVSAMGVPSFETLKLLKRELVVNTAPIAQDEGDLIKALLVGFAMALDQLKGGKKGIVNFVVVTNSRSPFEVDDDLGQNFAAVLASLNNGRVFVASIDKGHKPRLKRENEEKWTKIFADINNGSEIVSFDEALAMIKDPSRAIPKLVRPVKIFEGELRLGCDLNAIDEVHFGTEGVQYNQWTDSMGLCMSVEGYPFIKRESVMSSKTFVVASSDPRGQLAQEQLHPVKFLKDYKIEDKNAEKRGEEIPMKSISLDETLSVFKYGASVVPLNETLSKVSRYRTYSGIDIRGIMKLDDLPVCYLTEESLMIVNKGVYGSKKDVTSFNALVAALLNLNSVAIVRYVLKSQAEANMGVLIPLSINADKLRTNKREAGEESLERDAYCFSLVRLPFKEDEKITGFTKLNRVIETAADKKFADFIPDRKMVDSMVDFVNAMDLDQNSDDVDETTQESKYLSPNEYDFTLPVPQNLRHLINQMESGKLNPITSKLIHPSPALHTLQDILGFILIQGADSAQDLDQDAIGDLVLKNKEKVTEIIDRYNEERALPLSRPQFDLSDSRLLQRLVKLLDNQYREPEKGRTKEENDELVVKHEDDQFDVDAILATGRRT